MAVKVAKNRAGVAATAPSMETCQRTPDPARSHKAAPVWWGCLPATRLFLGLLLGPLGIGWAGRAWVPRWSDVSSGARCHSPRNATVTGPIPQRRRPTLPTTRVPACKAKTTARCQPLPPLIILHSLSFSSDRDFSLRISHDTPPPSSPRLRVFRPDPFLAQPSQRLHRTHTRFQRHQTNPLTLPDRIEEVPLATTNRHTITHRESNRKKPNSYIEE